MVSVLSLTPCTGFLSISKSISHFPGLPSVTYKNYYVALGRDYKGLLTPMRHEAVHRVVYTSETRQGIRHVAAKISCFKMDRVHFLVLLCEEAENEEYEVRNKRKRFWVHVALLKIILLL